MKLTNQKKQLVINLIEENFDNFNKKHLIPFLPISAIAVLKKSLEW